MSQSIVNRPVSLALPFPQPAGAQPHRTSGWARARAYLATLRRDPRDPQVIDLRQHARGGQPDVRAELIRAQARIFASR